MVPPARSREADHEMTTKTQNNTSRMRRIARGLA
jgi:hypothetical protein